MKKIKYRGKIILSLNKTTKDMYYIGDKYIEKRKAEHIKIIGYLINNDINTQEPPQAILLGGGSASGKSTLSKQWLDAYEKNSIPITYIDCDEIKLLIPEYENVKQYNEETAAVYVHDESSDIARELMEECIAGKKNFLYDGTMKNLKKYQHLIQHLKENGYNIVVTVVDVPLDEAKKRAYVRFLETGRSVPIQIIEESHREVPKTFYVIKDMVDEYTLYDTTGIIPKEVIEKTIDGNILIHNQGRLDEFYNKSK
ncbi:Zeta toxin [Bacillus cereus]|nr:Zeta toxin [Bacillus cereus]PFQ48678.1 Zeta toxin [Bacillus cereus]